MATVNTQIIPGVSRLSRSQAFSAKQVYKKTKSVAKPAAKAAEEPKVKTVGGAKNGGKRTIATKAPRFYTADDIKTPKKSRKAPTKTSLRASITPGTVLIVLSGRFRGRRVVFLKQLESGLLLITGPYGVNKVPLRRVNQAYVIATSTKIDISNVKVDEKVNDSYFKKEKKRGLPEEKKTTQQVVDKEIIAALEKDALLKAYLKKGFSLDRTQFPHNMKF